MTRRLAPVLVLAAISLSLAGASAAQAEPALSVSEACLTDASGQQRYGATISVTGFPPNTSLNNSSVEFQTIEPDGSLGPGPGVSGGTSGPFTDANGNYTITMAWGVAPSVVTVTLASDLFPGGSETKTVTARCEQTTPPPPAELKTARKPKLAKQCRRGGYRRFKFKSQRQCVAYVRRGPRAR
jgi:hypothetical protein